MRNVRGGRLGAKRGEKNDREEKRGVRRVKGGKGASWWK